MELLTPAHAVMNIFVAGRKVLDSLTRKVLLAADQNHKTGEMEIAFFEFINEWRGIHEVINTNK